MGRSARPAACPHVGSWVSERRTRPKELRACQTRIKSGPVTKWTTRSECSCLARGFPNCGVPPLGSVVSSPNPLRSRRSGVVARCPPRPPCDLFSFGPVFVGDLAAEWRVLPGFAGFEGFPAVLVGVLRFAVGCLVVAGWSCPVFVDGFRFEGLGGGWCGPFVVGG